MKTPLEAVLQDMVSEGWANESDGSVDAPTGHFARVTNEARELPEIIDAFADVIETYGMTDKVNELIGHFLVQENSGGFISVASYDDEISLTRDFQQLQDAYSLWEESE